MKDNKTRNFEEIEHELAGKKILYIATKNVDYLRVSQQVRIIKEKSRECKFVVSKNKNFFSRIAIIILKTCFINTKKYDLVFVGAFPQFIVPFFKWKFRFCEVWVDFHISIYDTLVFDRKKIKKDSPCGRLLWILDKYTLDSSNYIVADTRIHGEYFSNEFNQNKSKIVIMYLEADKEIYYPMNIMKPLKWKNKYIVFYFGSMNPLQGIDIVLDAIKILKSESEIHFIIVGPINRKYEKYMGKTVEYIDWLTQKEIAEYIAMSDLCLAGHFSADIEKANRTIPGKAYMYEIMEKPMILGDSEANREFFQEDEKHRFVRMGDSNELAKEILLMR